MFQLALTYLKKILFINSYLFMVKDKRYLTDRQFKNGVYRLNALNSEQFWSKPKAQKSHTDVFGDKISVGEYYFRFRLGGDFSSDIKLSHNSMDKFLYVLFTSNPGLEELAKTLLRDKFSEIRKMIDSLRSKKRN